jgi:hypothetical protein
MLQSGTLELMPPTLVNCPFPSASMSTLSPAPRLLPQASITCEQHMGTTPTQFLPCCHSHSKNCSADRRTT